MTATKDNGRNLPRLAGIVGYDGTAGPDPDAQTTIQRLSYSVFMAVVSLNALIVLLAYYLLPLSQPVQEVLVILDGINAVILLLDFLARFVSSPRKARYFFVEWGWIDLFGSLPFHPLLRILRVVRSIRIWKRLATSAGKEMREEARRRLAESALFVIASTVVVFVTLGSLAVAFVEPNAPNANIQTGSDSVWFVMVTIATVGYGDRYPVTNTGRVVAVLLMVLGVTAFSVLTSFIASNFLSRRGIRD